LTFVVTDNGPGNLSASQIVRVVVRAAEGAPQIVLTNPSDRTVFRQGETVSCEAAVAGLQNQVRRVDFFAGTTRLGEADARPYRMEWPDAPLGDYYLTARAVYIDGKEVTSQPVRIVVSDACGKAAVVGNSPGAEIETVEEALFALGVPARTISREELVSADLSEFEVLIWAGGDAAGWLICDAEDITGTFGSENAEVNDSGGNDITVAAQTELGVDTDTEVAGITTITSYVGTSAGYERGFTMASGISTDGKLFGYIAKRNSQGEKGSAVKVAGVLQKDGVW